MSNTTISKGGLSATISSKGAELTSLALDGREYLWQADPTFWGKHAPVLFPIVGSLRGDEAESAQGTCRMPRHGLARINEHRVAEVAEDGSAVTFEFTSSPETLEAYPYEFKLNMTYAITGEATLTQTFSSTTWLSPPFASTLLLPYRRT
jgi:galactose mutarotase-like enzyme